MTMKILLVITKGETGGAQKFVYNLAKKLKEQGVEVAAAFGTGDYLEEALTKQNIPFFKLKRLQRSANPLANLLAIWEIKKIVAEQKFDVVHFNSSNALLGAVGVKMSKHAPKTVFTFHGLSYLDPSADKNFIIKFLFFLLFKFCLLFIDKKIFVCQANLDYAKKIHLVSDGAVIYNGTDTDFLTKDAAKNFLARQINTDLQNKIVVGSIGRLAYPKNYEFIISVFPEIIKNNPDAVGVIIGDGPERKKYEGLIAKNNLQNKFFLTGQIEDAGRYIKLLDIFVLSSKYEGASLTLLEALAASVPVLASNVGGTPEIVGNQEFLYKLDDKKEFLDKLQKITSNKSNANTASIQSKFTTTKMTNAYLAVYNE